MSTNPNSPGEVSKIYTVGDIVYVGEGKIGTVVHDFGDGSYNVQTFNGNTITRTVSHREMRLNKNPPKQGRFYKIIFSYKTQKIKVEVRADNFEEAMKLARAELASLDVFKTIRSEE